MCAFMLSFTPISRRCVSSRDVGYCWRMGASVCKKSCTGEAGTAGACKQLLTMRFHVADIARIPSTASIPQDGVGVYLGPAVQQPCNPIPIKKAASHGWLGNLI